MRLSDHPNNKRSLLRPSAEWLIALPLLVGSLGLPRDAAANNSCTLLLGGTVADCTGAQSGAIAYTDASPAGNVVTTINAHNMTAPIAATAPAINLQKTGANGATGTAGPALTITTDGTVVINTTGNDNDAIFASSVGGNGTAGIGGAGGAVGITNAGAITTQGAGAAGIVGLSVAGASTGAAGAAGGAVTIVNSGVIVTQGGTSDGGADPPSISFSHGVVGMSAGTDGANSGIGGAGATVSVAHSGRITTSGNGSFGVLVASLGGKGGAGPADVAGGAGGAGGIVDVVISGTGEIRTTNEAALGIYAGSFGGDGGAGGATTGGGGAGGAGGTVNVSLGAATSITTQGNFAAGIYGQSIGGLGGGGGGGGLFPAPGGGGAGGSAGTVTIASNGTIETMGENSHGILAESVGGNGGSGGVQAKSFGAVTVNNPQAAPGAPAAGGGVVDVANSGRITVGGEFAAGIVAASIGGGGGAGGGFGMIAVGGTANAGGAGGDVTVTNAAAGRITTSGAFGIGILGMSVGGGGGNAAGASAISRLGGSATGLGGAGGMVTLTSAGRIITSGEAGYGILGISIGGGGGSAAGVEVTSIGAAGGAASSGGTVNIVNAAGGVVTTTGDSAYGLFGISVGGGGGVGGNAKGTTAIGGAGGGGGDGGLVTIDNIGTVRTNGEDAHAVFALSVGGGGGDGGYAKASAGIFQTARATGGSGGVAGNGGAVTVTNSGLLVTTGVDADGIFALSVGGGGGNGGDARASSGFLGLGAYSMGGKGGASGFGGIVTVGNTGRIVIQGEQSTAILAISVGGGGGKGGDASSAGVANIAGYVSAIGGDGGGGGAGGTLNLTNSGGIAVSGDRSAAIVGLSVGGGGGWGGDSSAINILSGTFTSSVGGKGGNAAGVGGAVTIGNNGSISVDGDRANAIVAVSIGGGGGWGGDATAGGVLNNVTSAVGGDAAAGGAAGAITVNNVGSIRVDGDRSNAIFALSIGGGGGFGGDAISANILSGFSASISVGGSGAGAGIGGEVFVQNTGAIEVTGYKSNAIVALSVGGGGGWGGSAINTNALVAVAVSSTVGGSGGGGGAGGTVDVVNDGLIFTEGDRSSGVLALSVGGGGGVGGMGLSLSASAADFKVTVGGSGSGGGAGGDVTVSQAGLTLTNGNNSYGILAASIGGGGGDGGDSLAVALTGSPKGSISANVTVGGSGGTGGVGGIVTVGNTGAIITLGGGSDAVHAQSVGGGGGNGGDASATSKILKATSSAAIVIAVGGTGGTGGAGGDVTVSSSGTIVTTGDDSRGIFAQSIGGGGGDGGTGRATASTAIPKPTPEETPKTSYTQHKVPTPASKPTAADKAASDAAKANKPPPVVPPSVEISLAVGGKAGVGGIGGTVDVTNNGIINTYGFGSHGIFAESVGGGGGSAGGGSASTSPGSKITVGGAFTGAAAGGRDGGDVTVSNTGQIVTFGSLAFGIFAQSVGEGGGWALSGDELKIKQKMSVSVGGSGAFAGSGGAVTVTQLGDVATMGDGSVGVFAQSVGGGGGWGSAGSGGTDSSIAVGGTGGAGGNGGVVTATVTGNVLTFGDFAFGVVAQSVGGGGGFGGESKGGTLQVGGSGAGAGTGGAVDVTVIGDIVTHGFSAFGVLAQSVGGGGGVAGSHKAGGATSAIVGGSGGLGGDGGPVSVTVTGNIVTTGDVAHGVFAQSVGGGGGIGGDLTGVTLNKGVGFGGAGGQPGNGGAINIVSAGTIVTEGFRAYGIFAQSIGGGGGTGGGAATGQSFTGSNGGAGNGGAITLAHTGSIFAQGADSHGIFAQSQGGSGLAANAGDIAITLAGGIVRGGSGNAAGISIDGGKVNTVTIGADATVTALSKLAIQVSGKAATTVDNAGSVIGNVDLAGTTNTFNNLATGAFTPFTTVNLWGGGAAVLGTLTSAGRVNLGGTGKVVTTALTGNYVQTTTGTLLVDARFGGGGASDRITISGTANVRGFVKPNALHLMPNQTVTVLTTTGGFVGTNDATVVNSPIVSYDLQYVGNDLQISVQSANFLPPAFAPGLSPNQSSVAAHVQAIWNAGGAPALADAMGYLANLANAAAYASALNRLSPQPYLAQPTGAVMTGLSFVDGMMSCRGALGSYAAIREEECVWAKFAGGTVRQRASSAGTDDGYRESGTRFQVGTQTRLSPGWFFGLGVGYESAHTAAGTFSNSTIERHDVGVTLKHQQGPWLFAGAINLGYAKADTTRAIGFPTPGLTAKSEPSVWHLGGRLRAAFLFEAGRAFMKPSVDLDAVGVYMRSFSETGAGALNLQVDRLRKVLFAATPGVEFGASFPTADGGVVVRPFAFGGATWWSDDSWQVESTFEGSPSGTSPFITTTRSASTYYKTSVGFDVITTKAYSALDARIYYDGQFAAGYQSHTGAVKVSVRF